MALPTTLFAFVTDERVKTTKAGDRYFHQVTLRTNYGTLKGMMWNAHAEADKDEKFPHTGDIIKTNNFVDQLATHKSIVVNGFTRISKEQLPEEESSICDFPKANPEELKEALDALSNKSIWKNIEHLNYVMACLSKLDKDKLKVCPAAISVHHAYQGGLLVHTAEVLNLCVAIAGACEKYSFINSDVLFASAILHDIGKVNTYCINDLGMATVLPAERQLGHIFYGMNLALNVGAEKGVPQDFVDEVVHCIAAHHGRIEWGSVKEVQSIEAGILSRADYISSRNGMVESSLQENVKSGQPLQDEFKIYSDPYFASIGMKKYVQSGITSV